MSTARHRTLVQLATNHFQLPAVSKTIDRRQPRAVVCTAALQVTRHDLFLALPTQYSQQGLCICWAHDAPDPLIG